MELQLHSVREPALLDVLSVLGAFGLLTGPGIIYVIWKEWRRFAALRRRDQTEAAALRAEGFPPPDPPATDQPPAVKR